MSGNFDASVGAFTRGTSTIVFAATASLVLSGNGVRNIYNLTVNTGITVTSNSGAVIFSDGIVTVNGTLTGASQTLRLYGNGTFGSPNQVLVIGASGSVSGLSTVMFNDQVSDHMNIPATTYPILQLEPATGSTHTTTALGNIVATSALIAQQAGSTTINEVFSMTTYTLTLSSTLDIASSSSALGALTFSTGHLAGVGVNVNAGSAYIQWGSGSHTISGTYSNSSSSASWNAGTGTVTLTNAAGGAFIPGAQAANDFNNLTLTSSSGSAQAFTISTRNLRIGGALTVSDSSGTTTLDTTGSNRNITSGAVTIGAGGILVANASTITASGNWDSSAGTWTYGTSLVVLTGAGKTVQTTFYDLEVSGTYTALAPLTVTHDLTIDTGKSLDLATLALVVGHNITDSGSLLNVTNTTLNGSSAQTITGTENVHLGALTVSGAQKNLTSDFTTGNVTKSGGSNVTMAISPGVIWSVPDDTILEGGGPTTYLVLRSGTSGSAWLFHPGASSKGNYVDVQDSTANFPMLCTYFCVDSGRNVNWVFASAGGGGGGAGQGTGAGTSIFNGGTGTTADIVPLVELALFVIVAVGLVAIFIFDPRGSARTWAWVIVVAAAILLILLYFAPMFWTFG